MEKKWYDMYKTADNGMWKSVLGDEIFPQSVEWVENHIVDVKRLIEPMVAIALGAVGFFIPLSILTTVWLLIPFFSYSDMIYFNIIISLVFGVLVGFLGLRNFRYRVAVSVGIGRDGFARRDRKDLVLWIPYDKVTSISPLYYSGKGESTIIYEAKNYSAMDSIVVSKQIAIKLSTKLEELGYKVTSQGLVGKDK